MKDTHATRILGAVWFKHKYLTNPTVTPEDRIVAAIGGLAKTLTSKVPLQLRDTTLDKLRKLQEILDPQPIVDRDASQKPVAPIASVETTQAPRAISKGAPVEITQAPMVVSKGAVAQSPRMTPKGVVDEPPRVRPPALPELQQAEPRRSPRIAQLRTNKAASNSVQQKETAADGPAQNTRSKRNTK